MTAKTKAETNHGTKQCNSCGELKSLEGFHRQAKAKDGYKRICKACCRAKQREYRKKNKERIRQQQREWKARNIERVRARDRVYQRKYIHTEQYKKTRKEYYRSRAEYYRRYAREWRKKHPERVRAQNSLSRSRRYAATPDWLTKEHILAIRDIYEQCPKGYEVDHIVPIKGKTICGLHVPWNLQYLTRRENISKGNRLQLPDNYNGN